MFPVELTLALVIIASIVLPVWVARHTSTGYDISKASQLLTPTPADLQSKLQYDTTNQSWQFNQDAKSQLPGDSGSSLNVGGVTYSADLPRQLDKQHDISLTDQPSKQQVTMTPRFAVASGQQQQGYVVYPVMGQKSQLIYSFQKAGLKEDIVLYKAPGDNASYQYQLQLPSGMEARLQSDGSVGIFGGDPSLFGNISYGSSQDQALVDKARQHSAKDHLYYVIPAPTITGNATSMVKAKFVLNDSQLTVQVSGLAAAHYPLSIDPSFVMNTTNCGWQAGNNESNATISGCQIKRDGLSGGLVGAWASADTGTPLNGTGRFNFSSVAYNGYLYIMGGQIYSSGPAQNNDVLYVKINSNGTLGSWQTGPSFLGQSRVNFASAAHNGYLYIFGGVNAANAMTNDVQYIKIGANGAPTNGWQYTYNSTSSATVAGGMPTARYGETATIYNNYVYVVGGCQYANGGCIKAGNVDGIINTNIVIAAPINGDGTIGSWTATSAPNATGIYNHDAEVYNGYLYIMGGCTKNYVNLSIDTGYCDTPGMQNAVSYAPINADGSLGTWQATASFVTPRQSAAATVSDGYLYVMGGCSQGAGCGTNTGFLNDVQVAPIYANGGLGTWQATTSFTTARYSQGAAMYGGYAYVFGGCSATNSGQCVNGNYQADTQYASISTPGVTSAYSTAANFDTAGRTAFATVAYGGYVYVVGGTTGNTGGASTMLNTLRYAPINSDGSLGTWTTSSTGFNNVSGIAPCTTAANCPGRVNMAAGVYNGYLYIAGGVSNGSANQWSDVQSTPLNPATGAPGTWTTIYTDYLTNSTSTYTEADGRSQVGMQIYNGTMYLIGGFNSGGGTNGTNYADIYYATLTASGGAGNFTHSAVSLPSARAGVKTFVQSGRLYIVGGGSGQGWGTIAGNSDADDVQFIPIKSDGSLDGSVGWKDANAAGNGGSGSSFIAAHGLSDYGVTVSNGYLYISGGQNGAGPTNTFSVVYKAKINADGSLGAWSTTSSLTTPRYGAGSVAVNGYLYIIAGCNSYNGFIGVNCNSTNSTNMPPTYQYAQIYNNGGGLPSAWSTAGTTMSVGRLRHRTVALNGYIYAISGCSAWSTFSNGCTGLTGTVAYAPIDAATGAVGTWATTTASVTAREFFGAFSYGGYIYVLGGCTSANCGTQTTSIQYGKPGTNGDVTTWNTNPGSLPVGSGAYINAVVANNRVYAFNLTNSAYTSIDPTTHQISGSWTSGPTAPMSYDTAAIEVVTNGKYVYQLGGYSGGKSVDKVFYVPINSDGSLGGWSVARSLDAGRHDSFVAAIYDGYLYVAGGFNTGGSYTTSTDSQFASINANGSLGLWQRGSQLPVARTATSGVAYNGYLYAVGGVDSGSIRNTLDWSPLQTMAAIGHYSLRLATDMPTTPANFFTTTSPQSGSSIVTIGFAGATTASPGFGLPSNTSNPIDGQKYPLTISGDGISYYWLPITIDDSQSFTFGESSQSSVGYFQLNYHPNPGMRLRGGKTFNGQQLQSLDAP